MAKKNNLVILPLGGLEQIGANCTMIGYGKEWIIVDLGIAFYDKLGIEILTPDISFPVSVRENIKGLFITHAHEDHIGAIQYLWPQLRCPIYLTEFTEAVLRQKLSEYSWESEVEIKTVAPRQSTKVGSFDVEYVLMAHSILGANGIYIKTPAGTVFHTGDWKIDDTPLLGDAVDDVRLAEIGEEGVDCLLCDSTNVLINDKIGSENDVKTALTKIVSKYKSHRITVTCFASNVARMETIFSIAKKAGRRVAIIGRSMRRMLDIVSNTSYFSNQFKESVNSILGDEAVGDMPPEKVLLICTGSQGEARSALYRLARNENKTIKFGKQDVVLFSSKVIPGNELCIREMQNLIVKSGAEVVTTDTDDGIHVSGHPDKHAIAQMYNWLHPRALIPIHGDARMLYEHETFARKNGISNILVAESGDVISLSEGNLLRKVEHKEIVFNAIDGTDLIPLNSKVIRERSIMSYGGHVSASLVLSHGGNLTSFELTVNGIHIDNDNNKKLMEIIRQTITNEIVKSDGNVKLLKSGCELSIKRLIFRHFDKRPVVVIHVHKV
ncbi:MAG: ribonuclease J [Holosporales bacterium]|jgi:ribonuclease J|nr:ribonuclease J [Holosporales bacterium]